MTSKLKCPFCQTELEDAGIHSPELYFWCRNCYMKQKEKDDNYTASPRIWQALIQAKQDLEIARDALTDIFFICEQDASKDANARISEIYAIAKKVLEHKE